MITKLIRFQIVCNAADSAGCKEWTIDPIADPNHPTDPGKTRARLVVLLERYHHDVGVNVMRKTGNIDVVINK
jgi:hypothetical protein